MTFVKKNFKALSLDALDDSINKDVDTSYVKTLNQDIDKKDHVRGSARIVSYSNDLTSNGLKYHSLDSNVQKKMDAQNKVIEKQINQKFTLREESYFDGFNFYSQSKGYTLDEITHSKRWSVCISYGTYRGTSYHKNLRSALSYVYACKVSTCKIVDTINNETIGFGDLKHLTNNKYLDNKINKTYSQNQEIKRLDNIKLSKEEIKKRNLDKMLKKD